MKRIPWNKGLKGVCKPNSGSFKKRQNLGNQSAKGNTSPRKGLKIDREKYPNMGHKVSHSLESKKKMSLAHIGKPSWNKGLRGYLAGEKNNFWKGGITPINKAIRSSFEYKLVREACFKRDNHTCIWCGQRGGKLNADHIKPFSLFPELRFALDNLRTLCEACHRTTDTYGGRTKFHA